MHSLTNGMPSRHPDDPASHSSSVVEGLSETHHAVPAETDADRRLPQSTFDNAFQPRRLAVALSQVCLASRWVGSALQRAVARSVKPRLIARGYPYRLAAESSLGWDRCHAIAGRNASHAAKYNGSAPQHKKPRLSCVKSKMLAQDSVRRSRQRAASPKRELVAHGEQGRVDKGVAEPRCIEIPRAVVKPRPKGTARHHRKREQPG